MIIVHLICRFFSTCLRPIPHTGCCVLRRLSHIIRPAGPRPEILIKPLPHVPGLRKHSLSHLVKVFPGVLEESVIRHKIPECSKWSCWLCHFSLAVVAVVLVFVSDDTFFKN